MAAPTVSSTVATAFDQLFGSNTGRTTPSITLNAGEMVVAVALSEDSAVTINTPTNSGTALTWTLRASVTSASHATAYIWTSSTVGSSGAQTISYGRSGGTTKAHGMRVYSIAGWTSVGANSGNNVVGTGAPSGTITTTAANSLVIVGMSDWAAIDGTASAAYITTPGAYTPDTNSFNTGIYSGYVGRYADVAATGAQTFGMTAPLGQTWGFVGVEIQGSAPTAYPFELLTPTPRYY